MNNAEYEEDWGIKKKPITKSTSSPANDDKTPGTADYEADWGISKNSKADKKTEQLNKLKDFFMHGVLDRPREALMSDAGELAANTARDVVEGAPSLLGQLISDPIRAARNVGAGAVGIPVNVANAALNIPSYLAHLESEELSGKIKKYTPQIPKDKIENFIGGQPSQEDINVRRLTELAPIGIPVGRGIARNAIPISRDIGNAGAAVGNKLTFGMIPGKTDPIAAIKKTQAESELNKITEQLDKAKEEHLAKIEQHKQAIEEAKNNINMSDSARMGYKINAHNEKLNDLNKSLNDLSNHAENVNKIREYHDESVGLANESDKNLSDYLHSGDVHDVEAARLIKPDLIKAKNIGSEKYDKVQEDVKDQGIVLPVSRDAKQINAELSKLVNETKDQTLSSPRAKELLSELDNINSQDVIRASDYMSAIKSVNGYMRDAYNKAFKPGINEDVRVHWKNQADQAKDQLEKMNSILEKNIGEKNFSNVKDANDYWRKNVIPLYKEPTYWKIMNEERMSGNMASELRGGAPGSGLEIIRNTAKNNPQTVKHIVGQIYDVNPKKIHNPNKLIGEYINQDPLLQKAISSRNEARNSVENTKKKLSSLGENANKKSNLENKISEFQSEIKQLQTEIPIIEKHMKYIKDKANQEKNSLKTKIQLEKQRDQLKKEHKLLQEKLSDSTTGLRKAWMIMKTVYRIGRKVT